jgi:hypothetical protein
LPVIVIARDKTVGKVAEARFEAERVLTPEASSNMYSQGHREQILSSPLANTICLPDHTL